MESFSKLTWVGFKLIGGNWLNNTPDWQSHTWVPASPVNTAVTLWNARLDITLGLIFFTYIIFNFQNIIFSGALFDDAF